MQRRTALERAPYLPCLPFLASFLSFFSFGVSLGLFVFAVRLLF